MPNEEVLELQIRDNAGVAAASLQALASSLEKVKSAVGKGLHLKGTISSLEKLKEAVNTGLNEDSLNKFERLATTLERLQSVGGLKIAGIKNIANQLDVADSLGDAKEQIAETANDMTVAVDRGMEEIETGAEKRQVVFLPFGAALKRRLRILGIVLPPLLQKLMKVVLGMVSSKHLKKVLTMRVKVFPGCLVTLLEL